MERGEPRLYAWPHERYTPQNDESDVIKVKAQYALAMLNYHVF
jgi:hypothetical protein